MKKQLKKCKGLTVGLPCALCKRKDSRITEALVKALSTDPDNETQYCIHFIMGKGK